MSESLPADRSRKSSANSGRRSGIGTRDIAPKDNRNGRASVDGWSINLATETATIEAIVEAAKAARPFTCFTLNLDHLVWLRRSLPFQKAYRRATFVTADGAPIALIARRQWASVERTAGSDLFVPLCEAAAWNDIPVYLFGSSQDTLSTARKHLLAQTGGRLRLVGMEAPPHGFEPNSAAAQAAIRRIERSGARLCFVMLGAPKQELFSARAIEMGVNCGFVCVGAAGDFISGQQVRAPQMMRGTGTEWLWRLARNPRRLGTRYLRCALLLARLELGYRVGALASK